MGQQGHQPAGARPPFVFWTSLWGVGAAAFVVLVALEMSRATSGVIGRDFVNLWMGARLFLAGRTAEVFDLLAYERAVTAAFGDPLGLNYSYPPSALLLTAPFGLLPYPASLALWSVLGIVAFTLAARPYAPFPALLAALTPGALLCLWFGHYGLVLGALWLVFFRLLGTARGGLAAALLTIKPHMGLLVALAALRKRRTLAAAIAGTIVLVGLSAAIVGVESWGAFLTRTSRVQQAILVAADPGQLYFRMMPSAYVVYGRGAAAILLQVGFALAALGIVLRGPPDPFTYATATFLILPYVFLYDMTVVSLGFAILLHARWAALGRGEIAVAALAFCAPALTFVAGPIVPPILLAGLVVLARHGPLPATARGASGGGQAPPERAGVGVAARRGSTSQRHSR